MASLLERASGIAASAAAAVGEGVNMAKDRVSTTVEGNKMLSDGGPPMEAKILTKAACQSAVQIDAIALGQLEAACKQYTEAAQLLEKQSSDSSVSTANTAEETAEFAALAAKYRERATAMEVVITTLKQSVAPTTPAMSLAESDARQILILKGKAVDVGTQVKQVADQAIADVKTKVAGEGSTA
mmetsp:Transcript_30400/g.64391  ORF Transcript_30400/g.64391 Transcript_30400/m.64391 type:complete len:185 (-) Transcript_30400:61-615(-)